MQLLSTILWVRANGLCELCFAIQVLGPTSRRAVWQVRPVGPTAGVQGASRAGRSAGQVRDGEAESPGRSSSAGIAGTLVAVNYLAEVGQQYSSEYQDRFPGFTGRRLDLKTGLTVIREYDHVLSAAILDELEMLRGVQIHGITDRGRLAERVPTVSFTWEGREPREIAAALGEQGIFVWDGNYYALAVTERLGLEDRGGMVRIGAVHYNTVEEIHRTGDALRTMA
jgi:selenocysteine lyase/cysteine desulfurase